MSKQNNTCDTERAELLSKLEGISFAVFMTVLSEEMALEIETMSSEGTSYQWIGYDDWNVYKLNTCGADRWSEIMEKLESNELTAKDLDGTDLGRLVSILTSDEYLNEEFSTLLAGLIDISSEVKDTFYCYCEDGTAQFFSSIGELKAALQDAYPASSSWEDMSTDELRSWFKRYEDEGDSFPAIEFSEEPD